MKGWRTSKKPTRNKPVINFGPRSAPRTGRPASVLHYDVELPPGVTVLEVPAAFIALGTAFKFQVLATEASGNETSAESCFEIEE